MGIMGKLDGLNIDEGFLIVMEKNGFGMDYVEIFMLSDRDIGLGCSLVFDMKGEFCLVKFVRNGMVYILIFCCLVEDFFMFFIKIINDFYLRIRVVFRLFYYVLFLFWV